jgi:quinol monooxygenase YgiN
MLKVAEDFIHPDAVDTVLPLYRELVACTQREPLCLGYELFVDQKDPGTSSSSSNGPTAPLDIHCASEHFQRLVPQINAFQRAPCRFLLMDAAPL